MPSYRGRTTVDLYHPDTEECYTFVVDWTHYQMPGLHSYPNGDPGYPEEDELTWTSTLTHIDGQQVPPSDQLPDWVDISDIEEQIDLGDYYD